MVFWNREPAKSGHLAFGELSVGFHKSGGVKMPLSPHMDVEGVLSHGVFAVPKVFCGGGDPGVVHQMLHALRMKLPAVGRPA